MMIHIIIGEEPLLAQEACDDIRLSVRKQGIEERQVFYIESGFDWKKMQEGTDNFSLFSTQKFIEIHFISGKVSKEAQAFFTHFLQLNSPDILLIRFPKLETGEQNSTWYKNLEKNAKIIAVRPIKEEQLPGWILQRLKKAGFDADKNALDYFSAQVAGHLLAAQQEIEKLTLLFPPGKLTVEQLQQALSDHAHYDIYALADAAIAGNTKRCLRILGTLKTQDAEPILILWALTREIRLLIHLQYKEKVYIWENKLPAYQKCLRRFYSTKKSLDQLLIQAYHIDKLAKGIEKGDVWDALLTLTLQISACDVAIPSAVAGSL
jgi:DNA polymerase-3 subunit delta